MKTVSTVLGPVAPGDLGVTMPHEHTVISFNALWRPPGDESRLAESMSPFDAALRSVVNHDPNLVLDAIGNPNPHLLVAELIRFAAAGGHTIVDVTPIGVGRDPYVLQALSRLTGVQIVMSTSFYIEPFHPVFLDAVDEDRIAEVFVSEITVGVAGSGIRAGLIGELGTGSPMTDQERKVLRGAAIAQAETGVSLNVHRTSYPDGDAVAEGVDLLLSVGVPPDRIVVSHCDERPEPSLALDMARRGVFVELDTFGMEAWAVSWGDGDGESPAATDTQRITLLKELFERGYSDQVLVSQDVCNKAQLTAFGGYGYAHLLQNVAGRLLRNGFAQSDLDLLMIDNPARMLTPA